MPCRCSDIHIQSEHHYFHNVAFPCWHSPSNTPSGPIDLYTATFIGRLSGLSGCVTTSNAEFEVARISIQVICLVVGKTAHLLRNSVTILLFSLSAAYTSPSISLNWIERPSRSRSIASFRDRAVACKRVIGARAKRLTWTSFWWIGGFYDFCFAVHDRSA